MPETMDDSFKDKWGVYMGNDTVQVSCTRMANLMARGELDMQEADFLSLDVEGAEGFVLKASPISSFKMMVVETGAGEGKGGRDGEDVDTKRSRILGMLFEAGFVKPTSGPLAADNRIENNEVFIRNINIYGNDKKASGLPAAARSANNNRHSSGYDSSRF